MFIICILVYNLLFSCMLVPHLYIAILLIYCILHFLFLSNNNLCLTSCIWYIEPCSLFISLHLLGSILLLLSKVTLYFHFCSKCCYTLSCPIYPLSFGRILTKSSHPSSKMTFVSSLHLCLLSIFSLVMFLSCWLYQMYLSLSLNFVNNNILYFNMLHSINILLQVIKFCA
jgi:hypothetical protein